MRCNATIAHAFPGGITINSERIADAFDAYRDRIYRLARRYFWSPEIAEDVVQETFVRLVQADREFESEEHVANWLIFVAANICKNLIREAVNHKTYALEAEAERVCDSKVLENYNEAQANAEIIALLYECIDQLPESFQKVVRMRYQEELEVGDIAERMETTENAVYAMLTRARQRLRNTYNEKSKRGEVPHARIRSKA